MLLKPENAGTAWVGPAMLQIMPGPLALLIMYRARKHESFRRHDCALL